MIRVVVVAGLIVAALMLPRGGRLIALGLAVAVLFTAHRPREP